MKRETVEKANQIIKKIDKMKEAYEPVKSFLDFMDNEGEKFFAGLSDAEKKKLGTLTSSIDVKSIFSSSYKSFGIEIGSYNKFPHHVGQMIQNELIYFMRRVDVIMSQEIKATETELEQLDDNENQH